MWNIVPLSIRRGAAGLIFSSYVRLFCNGWARNGHEKWGLKELFLHLLGYKITNMCKLKLQYYFADPISAYREPAILHCGAGQGAFPRAPTET